MAITKVNITDGSLSYVNTQLPQLAAVATDVATLVCVPTIVELPLLVVCVTTNVDVVLCLLEGARDVPLRSHADRRVEVQSAVGRMPPRDGLD